MRKKKRILFVGSFKQAGKDGTVGGQMFACNTLINSKISDQVDWLLIDSTANTNQARHFIVRAFGACKRIVKFIYHLLFSKPNTVLLFCSSGWSFREKGFMAAVAKCFGVEVILAPRSGLIKNDIEGSAKFKQFVIDTLGKINVLLCQGPSWKNYYEALSENENLQYKIVHNWIDLESYIKISKIKQNDDALRVVFLGWITRNKGIYEILDAAEFLRSENVLFLLGGNGDEYEPLKEEITKRQLSKSVELLGWVSGDAKFDLLKSADVFILPSYREGYPNALIEAMASGIPVISTRVGSIPDLITDGEDGFLMEPRDGKKLAEIILLLKNNPDRLIQIGKAARQTVMKKNAINNAVQQFEEILV